MPGMAVVTPFRGGSERGFDCECLRRVGCEGRKEGDTRAAVGGPIGKYESRERM